MRSLLIFLSAALLAGGQTPGTAVTAETGGAACDMSTAYTSGGIVVIFGTSSTISSNAYLAPTVQASGHETDITCPGTPDLTFTDSGNNAFTAVWVCSVNATYTALIRVADTNNANWLSCAILPVTGQAASSLDKTATASYSAASPVTGTTATTSQANELVIGLFGAAVSGTTPTWTAGSGYSGMAYNSSQAITNVAIESKNVTTCGAQTATATLSDGTASGAGVVVTIKSSDTTACAGGGVRRRVIITQ